MLIENLRLVFRRDLERLRDEIESYRDEKMIWQTAGEITNSAGNLCLHLIGNLNAYIGARLGSSGYVRDRDREFTQSFVTREELIERIAATITVVEAALSQLPEERLAEEFPEAHAGKIVSTEFFLVHLTTHLSYHLGQINYHRRMTDAAEQGGKTIYV